MSPKASTSNLMRVALVGIPEIADRAQVEIATVKSWLRRHNDFPDPVVELAAGRIWWWPDVKTWIELRPGPGRPKEQQ